MTNLDQLNAIHEVARNKEIIVKKQNESERKEILDPNKFPIQRLR